MLVRLIKAVISAALLNKTIRNAFIVALMKAVSWILRPSTISRIIQYAKRSGISGQAALSALAAILLSMVRRREDSSGASSKRQTDRIIDLDEYTIVDDRH